MYIGVVQELSLVSYSHPYPICMLTAWILSEVRGRKAWHWLVILVGCFFHFLFVGPFQDHNQNRNGAQKTGTAVQSVRFQWQIPAVSISRTHTPKSILQLLKSMQNISKLHSANKTYTYMHVRRTGWHPGILAAIAWPAHQLTCQGPGWHPEPGFGIAGELHAKCQVPGPGKSQFDVSALRDARTHASLAASLSFKQVLEGAIYSCRKRKCSSLAPPLPKIQNNVHCRKMGFCRGELWGLLRLKWICKW